MSDDLAPGWVDRLVWRPGALTSEQRGARPNKAKTASDYAATLKRGSALGTASKRLSKTLDALMPPEGPDE